MSEEKRTISISYKADLKDLIAKLKQMPNVTEAEAKKMVESLDKQLQNAEEAAKQASAASQAAAEAAAAAADEAGSQFEDLQEQADEASSRLEEMGETGGEVEGSFGSLAETIGIFNPELGESIQGLADASAAGTGLMESLSSVNPVLLAGTAIVAGLTMAYTSYEAGVQEAKEATLELRDANEQLQQSQSESEDNMVDAAAKLREIRMEYKLLTGQITQYEFDLEQAGEQANESFKQNIDVLDDSIENNKLLLKSVESLQGAYLKLKEAPAMTEEEMESIRLLQLQNDEIDNQINLMDRGLMQAALLGKLRDDLRNKIAEESKMQQAITLMQTEAVDTAMEMVTLEKELADATEEAANANENIVDLQDDQIDNLRNLIELDQERFNRQQNASIELDDIAKEMFMSDDERKNQAFQDELDRIAELGVQSGQVGKARMLVEEKINQARQEGADAYQEQIKQMMEDTMDQGQEVFASLEQFAQAAMDLAVENGRANAKVMKALFRMSQIGAIGDIAFTAAKEVTKALALPKGLRAIRIGTIAATAAAQSGIVMAQQMPEPTFHMGGMAPDEMGARVLQGEAVLDRATVQRIGGEEGVQQLQQGSGMDSQVVVIQPFRHFGRFAREIGFRPQKQTGIRAY